MSNLRPLAACMLAEVLGTFLLVLFGCGSVHVAVLFGDLVGLFQVAIVWAISIMLAIYVVGPISGAHINPAITCGLASGGLFPWRRVPGYVMAQLAGAFLAAAVLYGMFSPALALKEEQKQVTRGEPGSEITAMCYGEYFPNPGVLSGGSEPYDSAEHESWNQLVNEPAACLIEVLGTLILALVVVAVTDDINPVAPSRLAAVFIGLTVAGLVCILAPLTQACFNPARDFGPRLWAYFAGWGEIALPGPSGTGWLTVYIVSPLVGGMLGVALYRRVLRRFVPPPPPPEPLESVVS